MYLCIECQSAEKKVRLRIADVECLFKDLVARFLWFFSLPDLRFIWQRFLVLIQRTSIYCFIITWIAALSVKTILIAAFSIFPIFISPYLICEFDYFYSLFGINTSQYQHNPQRRKWIMSLIPLSSFSKYREPITKSRNMLEN